MTTVAQKLMDLHCCIAHRADEDTCGHLCDLLAFYGWKVVPSNPAVPRTDDPVELARRYGRNVTLLTEKRE
jgi:hypothetical protein